VLVPLLKGKHSRTSHNAFKSRSGFSVRSGSLRSELGGPEYPRLVDCVGMIRKNVSSSRKSVNGQYRINKSVKIRSCGTEGKFPSPFSPPFDRYEYQNEPACAELLVQGGFLTRRVRWLAHRSVLTRPLFCGFGNRMLFKFGPPGGGGWVGRVRSGPTQRGSGVPPPGGGGGPKK